jgi:iron complex transport system ATP-binding protein
MNLICPMLLGLTIKNLVTGHPAAPALLQVPVNLNAAMGEIWMLGGRNGTGKSTLLNTIAGLIKPKTGEIVWNGANIQSLDPPSCSKIFATVLTSKPEAPHFSALEIVETGLFRRNLKAGEKQKLASEFLEHAGAGRLASRRFEQLSDGEKQRVMIARALAQDTPVLLLDEPTAYLDFAARAEFSKMLSSWAADWNKLIFVSSHDHHALLPVCTHLLFLRNGEAITIGRDELLQNAHSLFQVSENES